jgi:prephenate dehydratase
MLVNMSNQLSHISKSFKDLSKEFTRFVLVNVEEGNKEKENKKQDIEK